MKLFFSPTSPYVRKCLAVAVETGLLERIEFLPAAAHPIQRDQSIIKSNPLGKVPTLLTDAGDALYDSRVICEYLDDLAGGKLCPRSGDARWRTLTLQALGDGILDAALLARYEVAIRPEAQRSKEWVAGQLDKIATSLAALELKAASFGDRVDLGTLTIGCALWYLDLRYGDLGWRKDQPALAAWWARFGQRDAMSREWALPQ